MEANYRGKGRYYKGVIKRENRDGTFDVDYDDVSLVASAVYSVRMQQIEMTFPTFMLNSVILSRRAKRRCL